MTSLDTNILVAALVKGHERHKVAKEWITNQENRNDIAISEFILVELYTLLCNPKVLSKPLTTSESANVCQNFRQHPHWRLFGFPSNSESLHEALWKEAEKPGIARRRIYDSRIGLSLLQQGIQEFVTVNTKDFQGLGFKRVWNPLEGRE